MKKVYTKPEVDIMVISSSDVISLSSGGAIDPSNIKSVSKTEITF